MYRGAAAAPSIPAPSGEPLDCSTRTSSRASCQRVAKLQHFKPIFGYLDCLSNGEELQDQHCFLGSHKAAEAPFLYHL